MRSVVLLLCTLLASCGTGESPAPGNDEAEAAAARAGPVTYAGSDRDRLCLDERSGRAGFITYGAGAANCAVSGTLQRTGATGTMIPDGDETCRIDLQIAGAEVRVGSVSPACAYYCGPSASYSGKRFQRMGTSDPVTDLGGTPLC